jgi:hypothetical protein
MAGDTTKVVAGGFLQGTAPNRPKMELIGIPKKEALECRVISLKHLSRDFTYRGGYSFLVIHRETRCSVGPR